MFSSTVLDKASNNLSRIPHDRNPICTSRYGNFVARESNHFWNVMPARRYIGSCGIRLLREIIKIINIEMNNISKSGKGVELRLINKNQLR